MDSSRGSWKGREGAEGGEGGGGEGGVAKASQVRLYRCGP